MSKCKTPYCRNSANGNFCSSCRSRKAREKNPAKYCYISLKNNAKRRGKEFSLTFEQFKKFARSTRYLMGKGRHADGLSIDRIDNEKGYTIENIRAVTLSENASKKTKILNYDYQTGHARYF